MVEEVCGVSLVAVNSAFLVGQMFLKSGLEEKTVPQMHLNSVCWFTKYNLGKEKLEVALHLPK